MLARPDNHQETCKKEGFSHQVCRSGSPSMALNCRHWVALGLRSWQSILILKDQHISLTSKSTFWFLSKSSRSGRGTYSLALGGKDTQTHSSPLSKDWHLKSNCWESSPGKYCLIVNKVPSLYINQYCFCSIFAALQIEKYVVLCWFWELGQVLRKPSGSLLPSQLTCTWSAPKGPSLYSS